MNNWYNVCITDNTGKIFFNTSCIPLSTDSEIKNLKQHLKNALTHSYLYKFLDIPTAVILLDGVPYCAINNPVSNFIDDELLKSLFG